MGKRSDIPNRIIAVLKDNPSISRQKLADRLDVSYQAIQKHLQQLDEEEIVKEGFIVNRRRLGEGRSKFYIMIETVYPKELVLNEGRAPVDGREKEEYQLDLCDAIRQQFETSATSAQGVVLGEINILLGSEWDIILSLYSDSQDAVGDFVTKFLRTHLYVAKTSTAWCLDHMYQSHDA